MSLRVGQVAKRADVNLETIRFYEREGLLASPPRLASGYRTFPETAVLRIRFIKRAQGLGFSLNEIRDLLSLSGKSGARQIKDRAEAKIAEIERKIQMLEAMKSALSTLADRCPGCGPLSECPIMDALEAEGVLI